MNLFGGKFGVKFEMRFFCNRGLTLLGHIAKAVSFEVSAFAEASETVRSETSSLLVLKGEDIH